MTVLQLHIDNPKQIGTAHYTFTLKLQ